MNPAGVPRWLYISLAALVIGVAGYFIAYHRGVKAGEFKEKIHVIDSMRASLEPIIVAARAEVVRADSIAAAEVKKAVILHGRLRAERPPQVVIERVPQEVQDYIVLLETTVKQDTVAMLALQTKADKRDLFIIPLAQHDSLGTTEIKVLKEHKTPRFGFKAGVVVGGLAVAGLVTGIVLVAR